MTFIDEQRRLLMISLARLDTAVKHMYSIHSTITEHADIESEHEQINRSSIEHDETEI
jgi:hypothetical protein